MDDKTTQGDKEVSMEDRIEAAKLLFLSLPIDEKAKFAQWCHEEVEKGTPELLAEKLQQMNSDVNRVVAKLYDGIVKTGSDIYHGTNKMVNEAIESFEKDKPKNEAEKLDEKDSGESFFG